MMEDMSASYFILFCFYMWIYSCSNIICWKEYPFSIELPLRLGQK